LFLLGILSGTIPGCTIRGWGSHGEDIEVMRIVLRDEITTELMVEALTGITQAVERLIDQAYVG
jgi:glutamate decarboxylase